MILDELALALNIQVGNGSALAKLTQGITTTEEKFKSIQAQVNAFENNLNTLGVSIGGVKDVINDLAHTNGAKGLIEIMNATQRMADIVNESLSLGKDENEIRQELVQTSQDENALMGETIKSVEKLTQSREDLQKRLEKIQDLQDQLSNTNQNDVATRQALTNAINAETQALAQNIQEVTQNQKEVEQYANALEIAKGKVQKLKQELAINQEASKIMQQAPSLIPKAMEEKAKEKPAWLESFQNAIKQYAPEIQKIGDALGIPLTMFGKISSIVSSIIDKVKMVGALAIVPAALSFVKSYTEEWRQLDKTLGLYTSNRIKLEGIENENENEKKGLLSLLEVAKATGNSYKDIADTFVQMKKSMGSITQDDQKILGFVGDIKNAFEVDELSDAQQARAQQALSRMMQMKTINGRMVQQLIDASPRLAGAIAKGMNTSISGLRQLANQKGGISGQQMFDAIRSQSKLLEEEAGKMPYTWDKAFTHISDSFMVMFSKFEDKFGYFEKMRHSLDWLEPKIKAIGKWIRELDPNDILLVIKGIGGAILTSVIRNLGLWIASNNVIMGQVTYIMNAFKFQGIKSGLMAILQIFANLTGTSGILGSVIAAFGSGGFMGVLKSLVAFIGGPWTIAIAMVVALFDDLFEWITNGESVMGDMFGSWEEFKKTISDFCDTAGQAIGSFFDSLFEFFGISIDTTTSWGDTFQNIFKAVVKGVIYSLGFFYGILRKWFRLWVKLFNDIRNGDWKEVFNDLIDMAFMCLKPLQLILKAIDAIFKTNLSQGFGELVDKVKGAMKLSTEISVGDSKRIMNGEQNAGMGAEAMRESADKLEKASKTLEGVGDKKVAIDITSGGKQLGFLDMKISDIIKGAFERKQVEVPDNVYFEP